MKSLRLGSYILVFAFLTVFASHASAQLMRTWVSGAGDDRNPCTRSSPCETFQVAHDSTNAGGEIDCVDAGDFGRLTITKSITIDCGGTMGAILVPSAGINGITINANAASDIVTIRNLSINPNQGAGVVYNTALAVRLENVMVSAQQGCIVVGFFPNPASRLTIENSTIFNCSVGVFIGASGVNNAVADIHNSSIRNCTVGIEADNGARVNVRDSVISTNQTGIQQNGGVAGSTVLVTGSTMASNGTALRSAPGAYIGASGNIFASNSTVYNQNGGQIYTGNDNMLWANGTLGATSGVLTKG